MSRQDRLLRRWLMTCRFLILEAIRPSFLDFARYVLSPRPLYLSPRRPFFEFYGRITEYPSDWSLDKIAHQHFLACAWLGFWSIEERGPARWPMRVCWLRRPGAMSLPPMFDDLLDRMVLTFENHLAEYHWAREDHVDEDELRDKLFKFILNMEQVLFWLSRLGFRVTWSANYEQLMERLFPDVLLQFPPAQRHIEFDRLRASLFISRRPGTQGQSGIARLDAPTGIARIYRIPTAAPDLRGFTPDPSSDVPSARGLTVRFSMEGILEYLDELASGDGHRVPLEESTPPGHVLVGAELDLWIIALGYLPHLFYGATLPTPPPPPPAVPPAPPPSTAPPVAGPSRVSPPPRPSQSQTKKEGRSCKRTPTEPRADRESGRPASSRAPPECPTIRIPPGRVAFVPTRDPFRPPQQFPTEGFRPEGAVVCALYLPCKRCGNLNRLCTLEIGKVLPAKTPWCCSPCNAAHAPCSWWRKFSNAYEEGNEETLQDFRVEFWEHLGLGSFHPLRPDPRTVDWMEACHSYSYREFLSDLHPAQHMTRAETRRKTVKKGSRRHSPTIIISSGSEDEGPTPKKRKTSRAGRASPAASSPEVITVEDEEMPAVDDMRNYDLDGDVPMPPVDPSIAADPNNYDVELEPAPPSFPRNNRHPFSDHS
ncbi:hypothetical protein K438DRAFT_1999465 [Mycena galopus ATCC 62051]|nr:hypothetical protein K438DRAFT_1999465 [Mycena galopus ATCC 62051]